MDVAFELLISAAPGATPVRFFVTKAITGVGSAASADLRVLTAPAQWLALYREDDGLEVRHLVSPRRWHLAPGQSIEVDGLTLVCQRGDRARRREAAVDELAGALLGAESSDEVLQRLLAAAIAIAAADTGAIIETRAGVHQVAAARDADGTVRENAAALLSDTIVRDVLETGQDLCLSELDRHDRYASVPSVVTLELRSVLCVPMRVAGRAWGAMFLGRRDASARFDGRAVEDLQILAAMAVPFLAQLRRAPRPRPSADDSLLGDSAAMLALRRMIQRIGPTQLSVLVQGASGTGKELVARAVHAASARASRPLVALNCASVPESLLAAELFGYKKGAFSGAATDRAGLIESAHESTLFLDEVGDMPLPMQAALLRVIEQREVKRLGETATRAVDFRVVAATHRDLGALVAAGSFREDLWFRLREVSIMVPALAERAGDLAYLCVHFLRQAEHELSLQPHALGDAALALLQQHTWPGNVRELRSTMRRAAVLADGRTIGAEDLQLTRPERLGQAPVAVPAARPSLAQARDEFVRRFVADAIAEHGGNREAAARALGIGVRTLYRYLE